MTKTAKLALTITLGLLFLAGMAFAQADPGVGSDNGADQTSNAGQTFSADNSGTFDGPAELPRLYVKSSLVDTPAPGKIIPVNAGGSIKAALASAACGDT